MNTQANEVAAEPFEVTFVITDPNGLVTEVSYQEHGDPDEYMKTHFPEWVAVAQLISP